MMPMDPYLCCFAAFLRTDGTHVMGLHGNSKQRPLVSPSSDWPRWPAPMIQQCPGQLQIGNTWKYQAKQRGIKKRGHYSIFCVPATESHQKLSSMLWHRSSSPVTALLQRPSNCCSWNYFCKEGWKHLELHGTTWNYMELPETT